MGVSLPLDLHPVPPRHACGVDCRSAHSSLVIDRAGNVAQQCRLAQIELAFDVAAGFVDELAALELAEDVLALGVDEQTLDLVVQRDELALLLLRRPPPPW